MCADLSWQAGWSPPAPASRRSGPRSPAKDHDNLREMRDMGVRGLLIWCSDYRCSLAVMADQWADDLRLSDIEDRFTCSACGKRGADVRPDFTSAKAPKRR
jgi:hypothetical protein